MSTFLLYSFYFLTFSRSRKFSSLIFWPFLIGLNLFDMRFLTLTNLRGQKVTGVTIFKQVFGINFTHWCSKRTAHLPMIYIEIWFKIIWANFKYCFYSRFAISQWRLLENTYVGSLYTVYFSFVLFSLTPFQWHSSSPVDTVVVMSWVSICL